MTAVTEVDPDAIITPPFCRAYPIQTWVKFNGVPINARSTDRLNRGEETLVEGLEFAWGRQSSVDQPDTSSCTLNVNQKLLPDQAERVLARNYYPDPSHEYGLAPMSATPTYGQGVLALSRTAPHTGRQSVAFTNQTTITTTNLIPTPTWGAGGRWTFYGISGSGSIGAGDTYQGRTSIRATLTNTTSVSHCGVRTFWTTSTTGSPNNPNLQAGHTYWVAADVFVSPDMLMTAASQVQLIGRDDPNNDSNAVTFDASTPYVQPVVQGQWVRLTWRVTVNTGRTITGLYFSPIIATTGQTAGSYFQAGRVMVAEVQPTDTSAPDYFDGDTPAGVFNYAWTGTSGASTSTSTGPGYETRRNLLPCPYWTGTATSRWTTAQNGIAISGGATYQSRQGVRSTLNDTSYNQAYSQVVTSGSNLINVPAGTQLWVSADIYLSPGRAASSVTLITRDTPNNDSYATTFDTTTPATQAVPQGAWTRVTWLVTVNTARNLTTLYFRGNSGTPLQGMFIDVDRVLVTPVITGETSAPTYFDGGTTATATDLFGWLGTTELSPSLDLVRATGTVYKTSVSIGTPDQMGLAAGDSVYFSCWVYIPSIATPYAYVLRLGGSGVTGTSLRAPTARNQWVQVTGIAPVVNPAGTVVVTIYTSTRSGTLLRFDDFAVSDQPVDFNGDTPWVGNPYDLCAPDSLAYGYQWEGTPGASASDRLRPAYHQTRITEIFHTGTPVEVWVGADGVAVAGTDTLNWTPHAGNYTASQYYDTVAENLSVVGESLHSDPLAVWISGDDASWDGAIMFPPLPFATEGTSPDAWDNVAKLQPGQTWTLTGRVWVPPAASVQMTAGAWSGPHKSDYAGTVRVTAQPIVGTFGWQDITATVTLPASLNDPAGYWIAVGVDISSFGTWDDTLGAWDDQGDWTWDDFGRIGVAALALTDPSAARRESLVWAGEIQTVSFTGLGTSGIAAAISASDPSAEYANDTISDSPWPQQTLQTRVNRVDALARISADINIDTSLRNILLAYRDVDSQAAWGLLQDMATGVGAVLWVATHATAGTYLWFEDVANRASAWQLVVDPTTGNVTINGNTNTGGGHMVISGDDLVYDQIAVTQDPSQVTTTVDVTWESEVPPASAGDQTSTESHTVTVTDQAAADKYGLHNLQIETELTTQAAATDRANKALALARDSEFLLSGLTVDTLMLECDVPGQPILDRLNNMLDLLDGTRRLGAAVLLVNLPEWVPTDVDRAIYIEGGTYRLENTRWILDLTATPSGAGAHTVTWDEMAPSGVTWDQIDPSITWDDLAGVAAPTT